MTEDRNLLLDAILFAAQKHRGQVDKLGDPYIEHPLRVAQRVWDWGGMLAALVAVLHDVLEDTNTTGEDLAAIGVPLEGLAALSLLRHDPDDSYESYIRRLSSNPLAVLVKKADIADNLEPYRWARLPVETRDRLRRKYAGALAILNERSSES